jgi:hypothetical protein
MRRSLLMFALGLSACTSSPSSHAPLPDLAGEPSSDLSMMTGGGDLAFTHDLATAQGDLGQAPGDLASGDLAQAAQPDLAYEVMVFAVEPPASTAAATPLAPRIAVELRDRAGQRLPLAVPISIALHDNPTGAILSGTTTITSQDGLAVFGDLSVDKVGSGYTLEASGGSLTALSSAFAVVPGVVDPARSTFVASNPTATADGAATIQFTITLRDAAGNLIPSTSVTIGCDGSNNTFAPVSPSGMTDPSGQLQFTLASIRAEVKNLVALAGGVYLTSTVEFTPGSAVSLAFTIQPQSTVANLALQPPVQVVVLDANGNLAATSFPVTLSFAANPGGATLGGVTVVTASGGVAEFPGLLVDQPGTGYQLSASGGGLPAATSSSFDIRADPWLRIDHGIYGGQVQAFAVDPANPSNLLWAPYDAFSLLRSTDGGANWNSVSSVRLSSIVAVTAPSPWPSPTPTPSPSPGATIFYGAEFYNLIYKSTDGVTWSPLTSIWTSGPTFTINSMVVDPTNPNIVYVYGYQWSAATGYVYSLFKTIDGGQTWFKPNATPPTGIYLVIDPSTPATIYLLDNFSLHRSIDGGVTWSTVTTPGTPSGILTFGVDPHNSNLLYIDVGSSFYKSINRGTSWSLLTSLSLPFGTLLLIDPNNSSNLYVGPFKSTNGGGSFSKFTIDALQTGKVLGIDPTSSAIVYGTVGSEGVFKSTDGANNFSPSSNGGSSPLYTAVAVDTKTEGTVYLGTNGSGVYVSTDGGGSWAASNSGLTDRNVSALAVDPSGNVFACANNVPYKSANSGASWTALAAGQQCNNLQIAPSNASTFYSVWGSVWLHMSTNAGVSWGTVGGLTPDGTSVLAISPTNANQLYMNVGQNVYRYSLGWTPMTNGLPTGTSFTAVMAHPTNNQVLYVSTATTLYQSTDGGTSFGALSSDSHGLGQLIFDPTNPLVMYSPYAYQSSDGGLNWTRANYGLPGNPGQMAIDPLAHLTLYWLVSSLGVYKTTSGGQ